MSAHNLRLNLSDHQETLKLGRSIAQAIGERAVVALEGPLGAGKTTLVQGVGQGLGIQEIVNSPTFTMINEYYSGRLPMYHLDLYRLKEDRGKKLSLGGRDLDLFRAELDEIMEHRGVILIEWAGQFRRFLPQDYLSLEIDYQAGELPGRVINMTGYGATSSKLAKDAGEIIIYS